MDIQNNLPPQGKSTTTTGENCPNVTSPPADCFEPQNDIPSSSFFKKASPFLILILALVIITGLTYKITTSPQVAYINQTGKAHTVVVIPQKQNLAKTELDSAKLDSAEAQNEYVQKATQASATKKRIPR